MDLNEIAVFAKVVEVGSFVRASRELSMPKSTVSRKVSGLEERLGARLLQRTTRKLSLTDVGRAYYAHAARVLEEIEAAELAVTRLQEVPRGLLRVSVPVNVSYMGPHFTSFLQRYPEVDLEMVCSDRVIDLIEEGFDLAIRIGKLADSSLIARYLGSSKSYAVASPRLLQHRGALKSPKELERFPAVLFGAMPEPTVWRLVRGDEAAKVTLRPRFVVNDFDLVHGAALDGQGIALLPEERAQDDLNTKKLVRLLPEWCSPAVPIHAVYPSTRHLSPKVKAFVEHLQTQMREGNG